MKNQITLFLLFISIVLYAQNTPGEYTVENVKTNTKSSDFGTAFFGKGKVVFAAPKKGISTMDNSVWDNNNNQPYLDLYVGEINENGEIINKQKMPGDINSKYNEGIVSFTKDKKTVYFSANNYIKKKYRTDSSGTNNIQIFKATINKNGDWSNLKMLPFNSNYFSTGHPALNIDDTKLYFVSDRPGSMGKTDIFVVDVYEDGTYSEPRNLGSKINTSEREMFPFISDDNILYFSSNGHPGKGELDVFASKIFDNTVSEPINLETPVNSNKDDFSYIIDDSKHKGYFSSNRDGGKGDDDIYSFTVSPPIYIECQQAISGVVKDINTNEILPGVLIELFDEQGNELNSFISKLNDASFSFEQPCNGTYKLIGSLEGYLPKIIEIKTLNDLDLAPLEISMNLTPASSIIADANNDSNKFISGVVKDTNNQKLLPGATVVLLDGNVLQSVVASKEDATFSFDHAYDDSYTIVVSSNGYADKEIELNSLNDLGINPIDVAMNQSDNDSMLADVNNDSNQFISGVVKDTNNQKLLPGATVVLLDENGTILQSVTANKDDASFSFDHPYEEDYKIVVSSNGYADKEIQLISLNNSGDEPIEVAMNLSSDDSIIVSGSNSIKINTIYFNFDKFNIRPDAEHELDRIVNIMNEYPEMKINVGSHTDTRGKNSYNIKLSNKRANSTIQYLVNKGVSYDRVSGNGFGEEQLAENCFDEKSCTEFQHQLNRRSQFNFTNTPENITIKTYNRLLSDGYKSKESVANSGVYINYNFDSNNTSVTYTVQIGAFKNNVQSNKFDKMTNLFNHHYNDGYNRYFAGKFKTSDEARSYAILLKESGFDGAFLVGLKGDTRF